MSCAEILPRLDAYHDGELALDASLRLEEHLAACPSCSQRYAERRLQSSRIRIEAPRHAAPAALRRKIERLAPLVPETNAKPQARIPWKWGIAAAGAAAAVLVAFSAFLARPGDDALAREVVAVHARAMMGNRLVEVASSDRHAVKPWFGTRVDFAPPVRDFSAEGFALLGGRIDHLGEHRVAALAYRQREHVIDVFVWPVDSGAERAPAPLAQRGYNLVRFERAGMAYWLVSDLNAAELSRLAQLFRSPE